MPTSHPQEPIFAPISVQLNGNFFSPITPVHNFASLVNAQKSHYLATPGISYSLPINVIQRGMLGKANLSTILSIINNNFLESETNNFSNIVTESWSTLQGDMTQYLQSLQQTHDISDFKAKAIARAEQSKEDYNRYVDDYTNQIITVGTDYPAIQNTAIVTLNDVFNVVSTAAQAVEQFFHNMLFQIGNVLESIGQWISDTITDIGNAVGDAVSSVVSAIGDLF